MMEKNKVGMCEEPEDHHPCWPRLKAAITIITFYCLNILYKQTQAISLESGIVFSDFSPATLARFLAYFSWILGVWSLQFTNWH
jgi:hypothetical protein